MHRRRIFATTALVFLSHWARGAEPPTANAFSPIKSKLAAGKDAVLFINGDSTSYEKHGPYFLFAKAIGEAMDCRVVLHRWGEWNKGAPTGPKDYEPAEMLRETGKATLTVYLATLPGSVPSDMFAGSRRGKAMDAIPTPDGCLLHHGHNMRGFPQALAGDRSSGRGMILAALGMTSMKWPGVPQAITNQNPWKKGDEYKTVLESIQTAAAVQPSITLIDSHSAFIAAGKRDDLYRPNDVIHPSDSATNSQGAQLVADALLATWKSAAVNEPFSTPGWPAMPGESMIQGDFSAGLPGGWKAEGGSRVERLDQAVAVHPQGSEKAALMMVFSKEETAAIAGKTITITALVKSAPDQLRALGSFVCRSGGATRTFVFPDKGTCKDGWLLLVCSGIAVDTDQPSPVYLQYYPAFSAQPPTSPSPLLIRKVVVTEGLLPKGL
ncbi:MAG: SGNH/GDSL hydrolase family protein [Verrucomicrobiota bacterium]